MDEKKLKILHETGHYLSVPKGISMKPMLKSGSNVVDIVPATSDLKKYDVALYWRETDKSCVLHRVLDVKDDHYIFYGDNCFQKEIVSKDDIIGVAAQFYRNGKWISVNNTKYMLYVHLWCDFLPLRCFIFRIRDAFKSKFRKLKNDNQNNQAI